MDGNNNFSGGDARNGMARLGTIQNTLFTRPPNNFNKTGKSGNLTQLVANFVTIEQCPELVVCQYHVEFKPDIDSKNFRHAILRQKSIQDEIGNAFIFDGMILYLVSSYNYEGKYSAVHPSTEEPVTVSLKASVRFSQNDSQTINCYNIIIRSCLDMVGLKRLGRNHFYENEKSKLRDYNMEVWPGFETAVRQYEDQLMLCIENRFKMIRTESVWDVMNYELERVNKDIGKFHAKMEELFVGETVFARYNNKMYRVSGIEYNMTPDSTFTLNNGTVTTLKNYFESQYNLKIRASRQPVLISEGKSKQPNGAPQYAYLLPELCYPTGLTDAMRKDFRHMRELSKHTRLDPEKRRQTTETLLSMIHSNEKCCALLERWGIHLDRRLVSFKSRELYPEKLLGSAPGGYTGYRAEWAKNVRNNGNFRGIDLRNWVVIAPNTAEGDRLSTLFIEEVIQVGEVMKIRVNHPMYQNCKDSSPASYHEAVREAIARAGRQPIHMIVLILSDENRARYDSLKGWLCSETNIPSQCVQMGTLRGRHNDGGRSKNFGSIVLKIVLQMNCKMGGALWRVNIPLRNAMIVGYDLYHDSTLHGKTIGACVSTTDQDYTQFYSQTRPHENPTELGNNLGHFIKRALRKYYLANNHTLPDKIFLYRDGVGDGQIHYVKDQEVTLVQKACEEIVERENSRQPIKLAFIIVTKKVNMRIFKGAPDSVLTNPDPGTVVDTVVTRPERYDFYLVPQYVNQGTVTPVCYNVIFDNTGLTPDRHQQLAFKLCHLYYNWQGTVRVPAPCQYAHKLAFMVAQSIHREVNEELRSKLFFL